jgi:O-acetyl-ADP-ribose deacetylase (regulator of RNase III)
MAEAEGFTSIALPRLASGVGALTWDDVLPVIEERLGGLSIPVFVYATYRPGKAAEEPFAIATAPAAAP